MILETITTEIEKLEIGTYYINTDLEIIQHKACGNGNSALLGKGKDIEDAKRILKEMKMGLDY